MFVQLIFKCIFMFALLKWLRVSTFLLNKYDDDERTFSSRFHAWSCVHGVAKQTVSRHCVSHHSCSVRNSISFIHDSQNAQPQSQCRSHNYFSLSAM